MAILLLAYDIPRPKLSLRLPEAEREALRSVFTGLDDVQIARLLIAGRFNDIAKGTMLAEENKPLETLFFICTGHVKVTIAGREVAHLEKGNFVGEIAFLTEKPAAATVVAEDRVRALVFERAELNQFFRNEADIDADQSERSLTRVKRTWTICALMSGIHGGALGWRRCVTRIRCAWPLRSPAR